MGAERNGLARRAFIKKAVRTSGAIYIAPTVASFAVATQVGAQVTPPGMVIPRPSSITPNSGPTTGGTPVTIRGTNFQPGATVTIGGAPATGVTVVNPTTITATTPPGAAGTAPVTVTNPDGTSGTLPMGFTFRLFASTARAFTASGTAAPLAALGEVGLSTLPPGGTTMVANVAAAPILTTGAGTNTTTNTSTATQAGATATSTLTNPAIGSTGLIPIGAITASMITVNASSTATGTTAASTGSSTITGLTAAGMPITVTGTPNQMVAITLPLLGTIGTLIINEQVVTGNGTTTTGITVNALRFTATALGAGIPVGASVIIGSASTTATAA